MADRIVMEVARYRPETDSEPVFQSYDVPLTREWAVLDGLNYIKDRLDGTLSFRWSCRMGICGSCGMTVNGDPKLACATFLVDYLPGPVRIEPMRNFPVIRDLVVDISDFMTKLPGSNRGSSATTTLRRRTANTAKRQPNWRSSSSSACASTACCATRRALSMHWIQTSSGRRRSRWPSGTTWTPATKGPRTVATCWPPPTGVGLHLCRRVLGGLPEGVDPAGAIQRYKLTAATHSAKSLLLPRAAR